MYLTYYGLEREPFNITPDPDFLFLNESHKEALASIVYGIEKRKGFISITGGIGLGKTTIVRSYLETKDDGHLKIIYVFNANITFQGLLRTIYQELELEGENLDIFEMVNRLHLYLITEYEAGNNVVVIIDEAQNMPVETLENLRMLSNLETSTDKLIQIVFIGQSEFDVLLNGPELRQLKQRIAMRTTIQPLSTRESVEYIAHRLKRAGLRGDAPFTGQAIQGIVREAKGVPRIINILCDNALITGFGSDTRPVGLKIIREVISDFKGKRRIGKVWTYGTAAAIGVLIIGFLLSPYGDVFSIWSNDHAFPAASKPEVVRVPIKPEVNLLEAPPAGGETKHPAEAVPEAPPPVPSSPEAAAVPDGKAMPRPEVATAETRVESPSPESGTGQGKRRNRSKSLSTVKRDRATDNRPATRRGEEARPGNSSQVEISKDVDTRLLEMIRQGSPATAVPGSTGEKISSQVPEKPAEVGEGR